MGLGWAEVRGETAAVVFNRDVRPMLSDKCFACHGADANKRKAKLRLDTREGAHTDVQVASKPGESELLARLISTDPDEVMPPPKSDKKVTAAEVEIIRRWIAEGGVYQGHWAFEPPRAAALPDVSKPGWPENAVDRL